MIRIAIVDDHAIVRAGLRQFLSEQVDLRVTKSVKVGHTKLNGMLDVYNLGNSRAPQSLNTVYSATNTYLRPTSLLGGRLIKFGATVDF